MTNDDKKKRKHIKMGEYIIETRGLCKKYDSMYALNHVDISVKRGEIYGLVGENGAGKSTLLKILTGQVFPTEGEFKLFGKSSNEEIEKVRSRQGVLIENAGFFPELSIEKNLEYFRIQKGIQDKKMVDEVLELTGLLDKRKKPCMGSRFICSASGSYDSWNEIGAFCNDFLIDAIYDVKKGSTCNHEHLSVPLE